MDRFIQRLNIEHFERLLQTVTDESVRQRISMLLEEERAKKPADADKQGGYGRESSSQPPPSRFFPGERPAREEPCRLFHYARAA